MNPVRLSWLRALAVLSSVALAACADSSTATVAPPPDAPPDTPQDLPSTDATPNDLSTIDRPSADAQGADAPADRSPTDAPPAADASTDASPAPDASTDASPASDAALDAPADTLTDAGPAPCRANADCASSAATPVCEVSSGRCVACTPTDDRCPAEQYCAADTHTCSVGCRSDAACSMVPDGGAAAPRCDLSTRRCVECVTDAQCPPEANGTRRCQLGVCRSFCNTGYGDCDGSAGNGCETALTSNGSHCGLCGNRCPSAPNAAPLCSAGLCGIECAANFANCDGVVGNGCEVSTALDARHCGGCGMPCAAGMACAAGRCTPLVTTSCAALLRAAPTLPSGAYDIDPDGPGGRTPFRVFCDMTTDGGGWTYGAIVRTTTPSADRARVAGVTPFGTPVAALMDNEYSVDLTGVRFGEVRIDNFTDARVVQRSTLEPVTWDDTTYLSDGGLRAKRIGLAGGFEFRVGYYLTGYCALERVNLPMCFTTSGNPAGWVCDTDSTPVEGWPDQTAGELCGLPYCSVFFRDTACTSYAARAAVYGFAVR